MDDTAKAVLEVIGGGILGAVGDVAIHQLLLSTIGENPHIVGYVYANDVITGIIFGGATIAGLATKNPLLTNIGLGGFVVQVGEEIVEHIWAAIAPPPAVGLPAGGKLAPKFIPGVLVPKYQLGNPVRPGLRAVVSARPAITVGPYAGGITAPKFIPGVLRPKYMHGS